MAKRRTFQPSACWLHHPDTGTIRAVIVGATMPDDARWLVVLGYRFGDDAQLAAHLVVQTPPVWHEDHETAPRHIVHSWPEGVGVDRLRDAVELVEPLTGRTRWLGELGYQLELGTPGDSKLTTRLVRSVPIGGLERWAREHIADAEGWMIPKGAVGDADGQGRRGAGDLHLAQIAARYLTLCTTSEKPVDALAGELHLKRNTVSSYLFRARERDLLTSPGRGRPGGALTERARFLLANTTEEN